MAVKKEVSVEAIEKAKKALSGLPDKQPLKKVVEAALEDLKPEIKKLLEKKGYTPGEVVEQLVKQGIPAKLYHIKKLFAKPRAIAGGRESPAT